ncbi:MAG: hypothetical protein LBH50_02740 [Spirochaetaceae bacterium]|jgi:hypothetical protein|nr:hypothetical protein [Spirochaetaceae bacterium]
MIPFCLLWTPAFYIFWRAVRPENINSRAVLAFIVGSCEAVARFFVPYMAYSGGLGLSRYISAYVDYTSLPVLLPLAAALLISRFRPNAGITDFTGFTLLSMVPVALACFVPWSASHDPLRLTLTPLLWTALAAAFYPL